MRTREPAAKVGGRERERDAREERRKWWMRAREGDAERERERGQG